MRGQTYFAILLTIALGCGLAWLFGRGEGPAEKQIDALRANSSLTETRAGGAHGQIVPLVVDEFSGAAFIPAQPPGDATSAHQSARRVAHQPTIRRKPILEGASGDSQAPRLETEFPQPLRLLGIEGALGTPDFGEARESKSINSDTLASEQISREAPSPDELPSSVAAAKTHLIVDGDTLPQIARTYLGDEDRAMEIYHRNRQRLPSFDLLPIGVEIELPQR